MDAIKNAVVKNPISMNIYVEKSEGLFSCT